MIIHISAKAVTRDTARNCNGSMLIAEVLLTMLTSACFAVSNTHASEVTLIRYHPGILVT